MGKKKSNSHCLYAMMCSFLVLVSLVILISLYKDYKYRQIYGKIDKSQQQRRHYHKSAYKTMLPTSTAAKHHDHNEIVAPSKALKAQFYPSESILDTVQLNLTKFGGPVQGQVRYVPAGSSSNTVRIAHAVTTPRSGIPSTKLNKVASFLAVPYAEPPVGSRQFEPAKPSAVWKTPLDASRQPSKCPQGAHFFSAISDMNSVDDTESEDCLYLNIWTPYDGLPSNDNNNNKSKKNKKAVLVYLHSGLFSFGTIASHDFDGSNLVAAEDIIVVTVQFRLGALGFAAFDNDSRTAEHMSLALGDQVRALQWIHANIAVFGGDTKRITIAGHGSGAIAIGAHALNPVVNRLFQRAIVQGYQNLLNIGIYGLNDRASKTLSDELGCTGDHQHPAMNNTLNALKKCSQKNKSKPSSIVEYQHFMFEKHSVPFGPEFSPFTGRLIESIREQKFNSTLKPSMAELVHLFRDWNLFPKHIQFLIGLNSDDDYKLDTTNRFNTGVHFDDEEEENDTDDAADDKNRTSPSADRTMGDNLSSVNQTSKGATDSDETDKKEKAENDEEEEEDGAGGDDAEEEDGQNNDKDQEHKTSLSEHNHKSESEPDNTTEQSIEKSTDNGDETTTTAVSVTIEDGDETVAVEEDEITTISPKITSKHVRVHRSIIRRLKRGATSGQAVHLEHDEIGKLCRIVEFYRRLKRTVPSNVSDHVTLYRIDPRVLQNPLEEVSLAFGARSKKWLTNFDHHVMTLWASFVKGGDTLAGGATQLSEQDSVSFINLAQKDSPADSGPTQAPAEMHDSVLGWSTFTDLKTRCDSV